jgi:hypothetical protein
MTRYSGSLSLLALLIAAGAGVQAVSPQTNSPVAYVYVSRPTHVDGFSAAPDGRLTPVPGSPFANISVSHMSVTNKFLFGAGDDNQSIDSFAIAKDGSLTKIGEIDTHNYNPPDNDCYDVGPTQVDYARTTLYNDDWNCDGDSQYIQSYKIESNGELTFLANSGGQSEDWEMGPPVVLGTDAYLYVAGLYGQGPGGVIQSYKRQSNGAMELSNPNITMPPTKNPDDIYQPFPVLAGDPTSHIAVAMQAENGISGEDDGPPVLASFTAQSNGNLVSTNSPDSMAAADLKWIDSMSVSPTGKLLVVGGDGPVYSSDVKGFQIFHFNGASPITHYSGLLQSNYAFSQFGWDKYNHLYALGGGYLFVYTVTPTSIEQAPGSPYSIPEASSVIVLDLP